MRTTRPLGAGVAVLALIADQASKRWAFDADARAAAPFLPLIDFNLRLNPGVSFSFLPQDTPLGLAALLGFTGLAIVALTVWLWRTPSPLAAAGLGAIIGGALGNGLDRMVHGAVVDFLDLHMLGRHFFVFNVADAAINIGVALLIFEAFLAPRPAKPH